MRIAIKFNNKNSLFYLDQTELPTKELWRECRTLEEGYLAIKHLRVRGAPLIGVFAACCIALELNRFSANKDKFFSQLHRATRYLKSCRPTAVNLFGALDKLEKVAFKNKHKTVFEIKAAIIREAKQIHAEDIALCKRMARYGAKLIKNNDRILTHCNTGFLATSGMGTALAVIYEAHNQGKRIHVYIDETRPLLQGARLTAWELTKAKIPCTLISDNMAAYLMQKGKIDKVFLGADRIVANGDTANKIGTYSVALCANYHRVPFYVVAPSSTFDLSLERGAKISIEERSPDEVRKILGKMYIAPKKVNVFNPAFDVTPNHLITAIVSDRGVIYPPYRRNIPKLIK